MHFAIFRRDIQEIPTLGYDLGYGMRSGRNADVLGETRGVIGDRELAVEFEHELRHGRERIAIFVKRFLENLDAAWSGPGG